MLQEKIQKIQYQLKEQQLDYLLIGNVGHQIHDDLLYWLLLEKLEYGYMLIPPSGKPQLFAIPFEVTQLRHKRDAYIDIVPALIPIEEHIIATTAGSSKKIGIRPSALPYSIAEKLNIIPSITLLPFCHDEQILKAKLPKEISRMRQAAQLTDIIYAALLEKWNTCYTEGDAANLLLTLMAERGVEPSFPPIVASGTNAANPHHHPEYKKILPGFCVIDFGIRFKGYCSDMTRTIYIGTPTKEEKDIYETLLLAQEKTIEKVAPGMEVRELDSFCRNELGDTLNAYFIHSLGHGLGTQVHEYPGVGKKHTAVLSKDMVITIEPGIYVPHTYGMRIEDDILVTATGCDILTTSSKKLHLMPS